MAAATSIHDECLKGNNDDPVGGWAPANGRLGDLDVVLVAVGGEDVVGYVWVERYSDDAAICHELAVTGMWRRRSVGSSLLRAMTDLVATRWASNSVYLNPIEQPWLVAFYRRLGFNGAPSQPGYMTVRTERLAEALERKLHGP